MKRVDASLLLAFLGLTFSCNACGQEKTEFTLMRSGKIIPGTTVVVGDQTKIILDDENYILFPASQVLKTFKNRHDVFRYKAAITPLKTDRQNELLQWIVAQKNYAFGISHLQDLQQTDIEFDFAGWNKILFQRSQSVSISPPANHDLTLRSEFSRRIENHLVLGCGISSCHRQGTADQFVIRESDLQQPLQKRVRNFPRTQGTVDRLGPKVFLDFVSKKHGPLINGMYPKATTQYLEIATWVNALAKTISEQPLPLETPPHVEPKPGPTPPKTIPDFSRRKLPAKKTQYKIGLNTNQESVFDSEDEFHPAKFNRIQQQKWKRRTKEDQPSPMASNAPQRLISPDSTSSRN